jgi:glycosyltransferase involved in cell wall biosynthesis
MHVVFALDSGGMERIVLDLLLQGHKNGQRVSVLCLQRPGILQPDAEQAGALVYCANKKPGRNGEASRRILSILAEFQPDIVHTHQIAALYHAGPVVRQYGHAVTVHTQHNSHIVTDGGLRQRITRFVLTWSAARYAQRFFCVAQDTADVMLRRHLVSRDKVIVVPNGIDVERFTPKGWREPVRDTFSMPHHVPVFGTIGRLGEVKRIDILITAFTMLKQQLPDAHLLIVGEGPALPDLKAQATAAGIAGRVHFTGYQPAPEQYLEAMDAFVLTSRTEGMPLSVLEAGSMGVPVIASRVGGLDEVTDHGRTAMLYEFADLAGLTSSMLRVVREARFVRFMADAARERVHREYSMRRMAREYELHYCELLRTTA